ncbi:MAG TPA: VWA domain-containing protein [Polyangiaceae bacterium]|nr:VWA domain-containing protein [Polyangiaceae bacterium]
MSSAGAATVGSGGGIGLDLGGNGNGNGTGTGGGTGPDLSDACAAKISTAQAIPLDMYIMLDVSGSMLDTTATQATKWDSVKTALESFLNDSASAGLGVGLQYFPLQKPGTPDTCTSNAQCGDSGPCFLKFCFDYQDGLVPCQTDTDCPNVGLRRCLPIAFCSKDDTYVCPNAGDACQPPAGSNDDLGTCQPIPDSVCLNSTVCEVANYAAPASAIAALPGAAAGLVSSIEAQSPSGDTPTGPALSGALQQASAWAKAHPDHRVVAVLATDGLPTNCTPDTIDGVAALAKAGVNANPSISTFVIGVFNQDDVANGAQTNLDQIARQGGTNKAFIVNTQKDVTTQFQDALDAIRGARLACQYQIPEPTSGGTLDYGQVNVALTNGTQKSVVYYVKNQAACDPTTGGWYYDVEPSAGTPTKIIACPTTCSAFEAAPNGASVGIALGCETIVK